MDIAIEQNKAKKVKTFEELVLQWYHNFKDVFEEAAFNMLPEHRLWDHTIELVPDSKPYTGKIYSMMLDEQKVLDNFLEENLHTGHI